MKDKSGEDNLVMFLSGMGGTGKSEVIKAFVHFVKSICIYFDWNYNTDVVKITALTGAAACQIPDGKTVHSVAGLRGTVGQSHMEAWKSTQMLIVDEVSFLSEHLLVKLDKHMRKLKEDDTMYGGVHIVFVGDFFKCYLLVEDYHYLKIIPCSLELSIRQFF